MKPGFAPLLLVFGLAASGCAYTPISKQTGGNGTVLSGSGPVAGAMVSITDIAGTLSAQTDAAGRFDIPVDTTRQLYIAMANPMKHPVTIRIAKDGVVLKEWTFIKSELGKNYFNFGKINVGSR